MNRLPSLPARFTLLLFIVVGICTAGPRALAQSKQWILTQVTVEGSTRFSDSQIAASSGLKLGQTADASILNAAAELLSKSGDFSEVTYRYKTLNGEMAVTFIVVEQPKTMSCTFDNFVWFAPGEADRAVRAEVPLYDERLPLDGDVVPAVASALEHLLRQHHIVATVAYLPAGRLSAAPTEFRYSAKGNLPEVTSVEFTGGPLDPVLFTIQKERLTGRPFSAAYARSLSENDLDMIYKNHAYLRAHFDDPQVTFLRGSNDSDPGIVKLVFTVVPGLQYSWHGADWGGNATYSAADLDRYLSMKDGDPAAFDKISAGMDAVREAYGVKGYIAASLSPKQSFDDAARQVHYSFQIKEGSQFHMGLLTVSGFDDKSAERIHKVWRLKTGDIYDSSFLKEFGKKDLSEALSGSPAAVRSGRISMSMRPNQNTLAVDIDVSLSTN